MTDFQPTNHSRPFVDIVKERAQRFHPYPQKLVEQFEQLDRAFFVPEYLHEQFLDRVHTNEGCAGLLSQPGVIFMMVALLFLNEHVTVFEGGTGTGYQTAIMARLCKHVYSVERDPKRVEFAKDRLAKLGIENVTIMQGDAAEGLPQYAPFDRMIFGCAFSQDHIEQDLLDQMGEKARLIAPTGTYRDASVWGDLLMVTKQQGRTKQEIEDVFKGTLHFVPLVSPRPVGWTWQKDRYVPSSQVRKWWQFWRVS
ncbi:protein-L-isoaspartate(D-aspartate) O-methyltransferase [Thermosporothrix hazakensis]|uniref:Protein-L-isoaspartate O-methyltransferase n=2 Tax=Thermosporothrix TaxID=768650 RepID=A0A326UJ25_THEHA|nr:methyltransferase domain-containing protein [Thermosporothrix hazakensis]PZW28439.1 protein-L-isoaspartate(D-aspartate) O-methyltransferase [Thermosporothrix hazakensis]BBH86372.1 protein-L-isoaspartate O-methyltransferase [Thermosporothrix sp. COM3]GCE45217.1 protein-L-isoaspartate O-methyltransferase [Thermosporothrix hazakensis]